MTVDTASIHWLDIEFPPALPSRAGAFLSLAEQQRFASFRFPKRRDEWLLGRYAAKLLVRGLPEFSSLPYSGIEIQNDAQGAPFLRLTNDGTLPGCLSISHSSGRAFCALTLHPSLRLGADLELLEPRPESFRRDYFTPGEQALAAAQPEASTLIWSLKEAMLKALGVGLRVDTRKVEVQDFAGGADGDWQAARVGEPGTKNRPWHAWWQRRGDFVLSVAAFATGDWDAALVEQRG